MKLFKSALILLALSSCTHTIEFRSSHFLTPTVSDQQWGGSINFSGATPSKVTIIDNMSSNPPTNNVRVNEDVTASDVLLFNKLGFDLNLSVAKSLEVFTTGPVYGLKWQFLNHAHYEESLVASVLAGFGGRKVETEDGNDKASSKVTTARYGASLGYAVSKKFVPYVSYVHEDHKTKTEVENSFGNFGDYENKGKHNYATVGISTDLGGLKLAAEYNFVMLDWQNAEYKKHNTLGVLAGVQW